MNTATAQPHDIAPAKASIVSHPWFPKLIGFWCAALFGLCSLALAPELLERIVATLGIDRVISAAAPPLGQTARLLLALGLAGVGEIVGLVIGRRMAASRVPQPVRQRGFKPAGSDAAQSEDAPNLRDRDRHPDAPARKPLSALSDLGDKVGGELSGIDTALRRRALASEAEQEPRPFFEAAPLPGGDWQPATASQDEAPSALAAEYPVVVDQSEPHEAFDLGQFDAPSDDLPEADSSAPFATPGDSCANVFEAEPPMMTNVLQTASSAPEFAAVEPAVGEPVAQQFAAPEPASMGPAAMTTASLDRPSLDRLGVVQLSERLALALQARRERRTQAPVAAPALMIAPTVPAAYDAPQTVEPMAFAAPEPVALGEPALLPDVVTVEEPVPLAEPFAALEEAPALPRMPAAFVPAPFAAPPLFAPFAPATGAEMVDDDDANIPALARSLAMPRLFKPLFPQPEILPEMLPEPELAGEPVVPALQRGLEILARRAPKAPFDPAPAVDPDAASEPEMPQPVGENEEAEDLSDDTLEGGYSSLLAMGSGFHRPEAVRIEEPHGDEIEPVVIFPGQGARTGFDAAPAPLVQADFSANAPFARPGVASFANDTPAIAEPANQADPEETDRALRAALASLQRISGAR